MMTSLYAELPAEAQTAINKQNNMAEYILKLERENAQLKLEAQTAQHNANTYKQKWFDEEDKVIELEKKLESFESLKTQLKYAQDEANIFKKTLATERQGRPQYENENEMEMDI